MDAALEAHYERLRFLAVAGHREALTGAAIDQFGGGTDAPGVQLRTRNQPASSATSAAQNSGDSASSVARGCAP